MTDTDACPLCGQSADTYTDLCDHCALVVQVLADALGGAQ